MTSIQSPVVNLSFYRFVRIELAELPTLRQAFKQQTSGLGLRGTILLADEGINGFVAGTQEQIDAFVAFLHSDPRFAGIDPKVSYSNEVPFNRMLVKIKKETIPIGDSSVKPDLHTGARVEPEVLKQWLDAQEEVVLLDTRNEFEVRVGTFTGAQTLGLETFRDFRTKLEGAPADWKKKKVVMFCTGGIRCEKATEIAERVGYENVFQLEGGILRYFERCGGAHYDGECFVFDRRVALDPALRPTETLRTCFECREVLSVADQFEGHRCRVDGTQKRAAMVG